MKKKRKRKASTKLTSEKLALAASIINLLISIINLVKDLLK